MKSLGYGWCPNCGEPGITRERRIDGNDVCTNLHLYPSKSAIIQKDAAALLRSKWREGKSDE